MARFLSIASLAVATWGGGLLAQVTTGDASRGEQLVRDRGCVACHKLNGSGGNKAPDLGRLASRNYTPAGLAGVMWNHAPSAWAQTAATSKGTIAISPAQAADLFAFFSSRRYFEPRGDAKRGSQIEVFFPINVPDVNILGAVPNDRPRTVRFNEHNVARFIITQCVKNMSGLAH